MRISQLTIKLQSSATLVTVFANFLLIDTLVSTIPRLVAVTLFPTIRASLCSTETIHAWLESQTESSAIATDEVIRGQMISQCRRIVGVLQALAALFALAITLFQMLLSLRVSAYARALCRQEDEDEESKAAAPTGSFKAWREKQHDGHAQ